MSARGARQAALAAFLACVMAAPAVTCAHASDIAALTRQIEAALDADRPQDAEAAALAALADAPADSVETANLHRLLGDAIFNQQRNDRYLMELYKKRGANFARFETVATQREGTSFALSDDDYGERKCVISGGLGTIQVSYQGKSYWVCCTGCQAAFDEDPATWIAEFEAKQKEGK